MNKTMGMKADGFIMRDIVVPVSRTYMKEAQKQYRNYLNEKELLPNKSDTGVCLFC